MDARAIDTLAWMDAHAADVAAHPGAAYAETEILRMLVTHAGPAAGDVLAVAYQRHLARGAPSVASRAEARALAHVFMFASNFGREALVVSETFLPLIDALVIAHTGDTDTLGELLIVARILAHAPSGIIAARASFDAAWTSLSRNNWAENYHAILVGALLYAMG